VAAAYQQRQRLAAAPTQVVDSREHAASVPASVPLLGAEPGSGPLHAVRGAEPGSGSLNAVRGAEPGSGSLNAAPEPQERAGEGARPSPVEPGGFAPPG